MSTQKQSVLNQFANLVDICEITSAARIYCDWAYSYQKELNHILATSDEVTAQAISDAITNMSGDYIDQP